MGHALFHHKIVGVWLGLVPLADPAMRSACLGGSKGHVAGGAPNIKLHSCYLSPDFSVFKALRAV